MCADTFLTSAAILYFTIRLALMLTLVETPYLAMLAVSDYRYAYLMNNPLNATDPLGLWR